MKSLNKTKTQVAREAAFEVLAVIDKGGHAEVLLSDYLNSSKIQSLDRALATEIVYGVIRHKLRLDSIIRRCLQHPNKKIKPNVLSILRIALYQIVFLDKIPVHAAVDEAVRQAKYYENVYTGNFVNAVLRAFLRDRETKDPEPRMAAKPLAIYYSHPLWLVSRWIEEFGFDQTIAIMQHNNTPPHLELRVNKLQITRDELLALFEEQRLSHGLSQFSEDCILLSGSRMYSGNLPGYREGLFTIQSVASQMIVPLMDVSPGMRVLDCCSAPGGKAAHIAEFLGESGELIAIEKNAPRFEQTRANLNRLGVKAQVIHGDTTDADLIQSLGLFDRILVDAPCSSLGVLRHNPEVKYRIQPDDLKHYSVEQLRVLLSIAPMLKPNGKLLYSVCTVSHEETTDVVREFLKISADHRVLPIQSDENAHSFITKDGHFSTFPPGDFNLDGFFAAQFTTI